MITGNPRDKTKKQEYNMLILARNEGESIVLTLSDGRRITVTVVEKRDGRSSVKLGIVAPPDVVVNRNEIQELVDAGYSL